MCWNTSVIRNHYQASWSPWHPCVLSHCIFTMTLSGFIPMITIFQRKARLREWVMLRDTQRVRDVVECQAKQSSSPTCTLNFCAQKEEWSPKTYLKILFIFKYCAWNLLKHSIFEASLLQTPKSLQSLAYRENLKLWLNHKRNMSIGYMALVWFLRSCITVSLSDYVKEKTCGIINGGGEAESWKVRSGEDFRNQGPPATWDRKKDLKRKKRHFQLLEFSKHVFSNLIITSKHLQLEAHIDSATVRKEKWASEEIIPLLLSASYSQGWCWFKQRLCFG